MFKPFFSHGREAPRNERQRDEGRGMNKFFILNSGCNRLFWLPLYRLHDDLHQFIDINRFGHMLLIATGALIAAFLPGASKEPHSATILARHP